MLSVLLYGNMKKIGTSKRHICWINCLKYTQRMKKQIIHFMKILSQVACWDILVLEKLFSLYPATTPGGMYPLEPITTRIIAYTILWLTTRSILMQPSGLFACLPGLNCFWRTEAFRGGHARGFQKTKRFCWSQVNRTMTCFIKEVTKILTSLNAICLVVLTSIEEVIPSFDELHTEYLLQIPSYFGIIDLSPRIQQHHLLFNQHRFLSTTPSCWSVLPPPQWTETIFTCSPCWFSQVRTTKGFVKYCRDLTRSMSFGT